MSSQLHQFKWRQSIMVLFLFLLTGLIGNRLYAQPANTYSFAASSGTFTPNVGGTLTSIATTADDAISSAFPIGFTFVYEGVSYTQAMASSNGVLLFGTGRTQSTVNNLATTTATQRPGVAPLWDDLQCTQGVNYLLSGTAPNRVLTVEWLNMEWNFGANAATISFQVKLYETTNQIEIIYRQEPAAGNPSGSAGASIGIMGVAATNFISLGNSSNSPITSTTTSTNNISTKPATGQTYTFTPPPPCSGTPNPGLVALTNIPGCGTGNYVLAVSGASLNPGLSYQWQSSPDSINWTAMTNDTLVGLTKPQVTALTYFRRITTCTNSSISATSNFVAVKPVYAGTANATAPICGDSLTLTLTGASASLSSFQWESSSDNITFTPIPGATLASQKVPTPLANTWYRAVVTCTASSSTDNSVSVLVRPARGGTTNIVSSFCLDSTTLSLTAASTGPVTYNWLSSTDSITWVSMGITTASAKFPSPTATRFYRCVVTCGLAADTSVAVRVNEPCQGFGPYSITRNASATFTSIQTTGSNFAWQAGSADDDRSAPIYFPAGFNFSYAGAVRPAFYVCSNGWLSFDTTVISTAWTNNMNSTNPRLVVAPFWDDLYVLSGNLANRNLIKYQVQGTAPNRVMIVEWAEMERLGYASPSLNFQVKLYEGTNNIEFVYGRMQPFDGTGTGDFTYSTGLIGASPAIGQKIALLLENTSNFSTSAINDNLAIAPLCNTSYLFTSGSAFNPTSTSAIPANDSSSTPILLSVNPIPCTDGCGTYYSTRGATSSGTAIAPVSGTADDDVWFSFVAPTSGQVNISLVGSPNFNPAFMVMNNLFDTTGLGAAASRNAATNALESVQATGLTPSATYLIRVFHAGAGSGSTSGAFSICVNEIIPPPANDDTSGAVVLNVSTACNPVTGTTIGSTASPQAVCGGLADDDVWYRFIPSAAVDTVTVTGTGTFRPHVQVLTRTLTSIACVNNNVNAGTVKITLTNLLKDSTYYIRVYHTNAGTASGGFSICVNGVQATAPVVATGGNSNVITISATLTGNIIDGGGFPVIASGIVYSTSPAPVLGAPGVIDSANVPVITSGVFNRNIGGLSPSTTYYYRAYATNILGTTYGADSIFTTPSSAVAPTVLTLSAINLNTTTATVRGNITSNGGDPVIVSGIVFSTSGIPTLGAPGVTDSTTTPLVASGNYQFNLVGLTHSTKYYFRAYATNTVGTAYGVLDSFTTQPIISALPYNENFDAGATPWTSAAVVGTLNDWVVGTPNKTVLNGPFSSPNSWVTKITGNYSTSHNAALISPQFDFSALTSDPVVRFMHKFITESCCDGGVLEISINGGVWIKVENVVGTGTNYNTPLAYSWYNLGTQTNSWADNSNLFSSNTSGWIQSAVRLTGAAGQSNVRFRFRFITDTSVENDGWAIDNIEVVNVTTPTLAASNVTVTPANTSALVNFTAGNGEGRLVVARLTTTTAVAPTNNTLYTANTAFGSGSTTGTGNFVVFVGNGTSVNVTGLTQLTGYTFDVYEYNGRYMHNAFASAATNATTTLPVQLVEFKGIALNEDVKLSWVTASEMNNAGFEVERSIDGVNFKKIAFVKGNINSSIVRNYGLVDEQAFALTGVNKLFYRLKQVDLDGSFTYSNAISVDNKEYTLEHVEIYPNPFTSNLSIKLNAAVAGDAQLSIADLSGRVLAEQKLAVVDGTNTISLNNLEGLNKGIYFVKITYNNQTKVYKLVKE